VLRAGPGVVDSAGHIPHRQAADFGDPFVTSLGRAGQKLGGKDEEGEFAEKLHQLAERRGKMSGAPEYASKFNNFSI
jgi:hypothetical protein